MQGLFRLLQKESYRNMKMLLIEKIATLENLILSWRKVENSLKKGEIWFDELDAFDFNLLYS